MASKHEHQRAYLDNLRDNQIGGERDGISREVAEDLGYVVSPERIDAALATARELGRSAIPDNRSSKHNSRSSKRKLSDHPEAEKSRDRRARIRAENEAARLRNRDPWGSDLGGR